MDFSSLEALKKRQKAERLAKLRKIQPNAPTPQSKEIIEKKDKERLAERQGLTAELAKESGELEKRKSHRSSKSTKSAASDLPPKDSKSSRKRSHEEESEVQKKRRGESDDPIMVEKAAVADTCYTSVPPSASDSSKGAASVREPSWLKPDFEFPVTIVGMERIANEINDLSPSLANLSISDVKNSPILGRAVIGRAMDPDLYSKLTKMSYKEAFNRFGGLVSELSTYGLFIGDTARRTDAIAGHALRWEKKCTEAEASSSEWKKKFEAEEKKMDSTMNEKNKVQAELASCQSELEKLKAKLAVVEAEKKELSEKNSKLIDSENAANIKVNRLEKSVQYYRSPAFTDYVVNNFQASVDFKNMVEEKSMAYLGRGMAHMTRQLHYYFKDKTLLLRAFDLFFADPKARAGANFVPFSEAEVEAINEYDKKNGLPPWTPPPKISPDFFELVDVMLPEDEVEGPGETELSGVEHAFVNDDTPAPQIPSPICEVPESTAEEAGSQLPTDSATDPLAS